MLFTTLLSSVPYFNLWSGTLLGSIRQRPIADIDPNSHETPYLIRNATLEDAHGIARVLTDAFATVPYWKYLYQFKDQYPEYHLACATKTVENIIYDNGAPLYDLMFHVIDAPVQIDGEEVLRPASIAIWQVIHRLATVPSILSYDCTENLDLNMTRVYDWEPKYGAVEDRYVFSPYGDQLYLGALATHPDWQEHGMGPAHCRWGQAYARENAINISLISTPAGYPVYRDLGFETLENITMKTLDGDDLYWWAMQWIS